MHLREYTTQKDMDIAIRVILNSFVDSQKTAVSRRIRREFAAYISYDMDRDELLYEVLAEMMREKAAMGLDNDSETRINLEDFDRRAKANGIMETKYFISGQHFKKRGLIMEDGDIVRKFY